MACTSGLASSTKTAVPIGIKLPEGSPTTGSRRISTRVTSMLSSAQPVTGIAPTTPVVLVIGVSKLPNGSAGVTPATFTVMVCGELIAPVEVTVTMPLDPEPAEIWNVPVPTPETDAWFTCGDVAVPETFTVTVMTG